MSRARVCPVHCDVVQCAPLSEYDAKSRLCSGAISGFRNAARTELGSGVGMICRGEFETSAILAVGSTGALHSWHARQKWLVGQIFVAHKKEDISDDPFLVHAVLFNMMLSVR